MPASKTGGYLNMKVNHLNARLFNRLLADDGRALYSAEQGKILSALWDRHPQSASELARVTGLANSTLTLMLKRLEDEQGLVRSSVSQEDKRKRIVDLTELGASQQQVGDEVSDKLAAVFYRGFAEEEITQLDGLLARVLENLEQGLAEEARKQTPSANQAQS